MSQSSKWALEIAVSLMPPAHTPAGMRPDVLEAARQIQPILDAAIAAATTKEEGLEYVTMQDPDENEFQVWTPDTTGACIGSGATHREAIRNAIESLRRTADNLEKLAP